MILMPCASLSILWAQASLIPALYAMQELKDEQEKRAKMKVFAKTQVTR